MEIFGVPVHVAFAASAAVLAPVGCLLSLWYGVRPESRDTLRYPMMLSACLATASVLAAYISGDRMLDGDPSLRGDPQVVAHQQYATRLVLPVIGYCVLALLTGWINPRTGALRTLMPMLLGGFAVVVLVLVALSGDADARSLWQDLYGSVT